MLSLFQIKQILHPVTETLPTDDFRIPDSWAEYDENSSKDPEKRNLQYLCYEMEVMNPSTGERIHCYICSVKLHTRGLSFMNSPRNLFKRLFYLKIWSAVQVGYLSLSPEERVQQEISSLE